MAAALTVWMYGRPVGRLTRARGTLSFAYTPEALALGAGLPLLSVALPTRARAYTGTAVQAFFEGLLPEGEARRMIAYDFQLGSEDVMGLLRVLGRDCAGALVILPEGQEPQAEGQAWPVDEQEIAERLRALKHAPLGVDERVRVSLAGAQEKLLLTRLEEGWGLPVNGAPSTHILKPAHPIWAEAVANEGFCLRLAHHLGVQAPEARIETIASRPVLVVARYDRAEEDGLMVRLHQEDLCQAHGLLSRHKYEDSGGPSLRRCAEILERWARASELERLLEVVTVNVLIGNADAHAKNYSLLHDRDGAVRLAPAYDLMSTVHYEQVSTVAGMLVNGQRDITAIGAEDLVAEGRSWGLAAPRAEAVVERLLAGAERALRLAASDVEPPSGLPERIEANAARLRG